MRVINISDSRKRNTRVAVEPKKKAALTQYVDHELDTVHSVRVVKNTLATDLRTLTQDCPLEGLSQALIEGDPEIDFELFGKCIQETTRIYLDSNNQPAAGCVIKEHIYQADGTLKEVRDFQPQNSNINLEQPLKWSGKLMPKKEFFNKFVFSGCHQITHVDGLTYDFLFNISKELEEKAAFLYMAAGEKMNQPLILSRNGTPYRSFLEGRTKGDKYMLLLHLTNLELKPLR